MNSTSKPKSLRVLLSVAAYRTLEKILRKKHELDSCEGTETAFSPELEVTVQVKRCPGCREAAVS